MHTYARHMHDICTHMHRYIHFPLGYVAKWPCMYLHVFDCICMYPCCMSRAVHIVCIWMYAYVFACIFNTCISVFKNAYVQNACICMYHVCILYVSIFFACILHVSVCIMYVQVCVCIACIGPNRHSYRHNFAKWPASGPASRRPHSGHRWAGAHLLCSAIQDNMSDPIWRTAARSTRRGGPTRVQGVNNRPPLCINTLVIPS